MSGITLPDFTSLSSSRVESAGEPTPDATPLRGNVPDITAAAVAGQEAGAQLQKSGINLEDIVDTADVNNAYANVYSPQAAALASDFYSKTGNAAVQARPQFVSDMQNLRSEVVGTLGGQAATKLETMIQPHEEKEIYTSGMHAGQQAVVYSDQSNEAVLGNDNYNYSQHLLVDPAAAEDDRTHAMAQMTAHLASKGLSSDSDIGKNMLGSLSDEFETTKQATLQHGILQLPMDQRVAWAFHHMNPDAASGTNTSPYNLGNVKTASGAVAGTQDFVNPSTPVDGAALTANTLRSGYDGFTLAQIGKKWTGESDDKVSAWVSNVSTASGLSADAVPDMNDPKQLAALLTGIAVAEKSPADRKNFTPDVITQGVQKSLSGAPISTAANNNTSSPASSSVVSNPTFMGYNVDPDVAEKLTKIILEQKKQADTLQNQQYEDQVNKLATDPHFTDASQIPPQLSATFPQNPKMQKFLEQAATYNFKNANNIVSADNLQYGSSFYPLLQNMYSSDGIKAPSELQQYVANGQLTMAGYKTLVDEMGQKNTPQGAAIAQAKSRLLDMGANAIYGESKSYGIGDPKGEAIHQKWLALTLNDYNQGVKAGKTPTQLLDPESPDYVGKNISAFQRTSDEQMKDKLANTGLPPRTLDTIASDVHFGRMSQAQAKAEAPKYIQTIPDKTERERQLVRFGLISPQAMKAQVPRPE